MTQKKMWTHAIISKGHKRCFIAPRIGICNIFYVSRTYLERMRKSNKKQKNKFKFKEETQSHTHLRIQKTNNKEVKVLVNNMEITFHEN
jgi:hypothetical protein